jgi:microcystin-dependent protein
MVDNPYRYHYVPIGGIIEWDGTGLIGAPDLSTPEKVAAVYGYGTWERYGTDRVTVGAGGEYAAGATGGEKEHTLNVDEMPAHGHSLATNGNPTFSLVANGATSAPVVTGQSIGAISSSQIHGFNVVAVGTGGNQPHNNMQPYIAPYRYRRIA